MTLFHRVPKENRWHLSDNFFYATHMEEVEFVSRMPFTDLDILVDDMVLYERIHFSVIRNLLVGGSGFANSFIHI